MTCSCEAMERALVELRAEHKRQLETQERVFGARIAELEAVLARVRELPAKWLNDIFRDEDAGVCAEELEAALSGKGEAP